ncbi:MAG: S8 family serine peptidase [Bacillota bacterium]
MRRSIRFLAVLLAVLVVTAQVVAASSPKASSKAYLVGFRSGHSAQGLAISGVQVKQEWQALGAALVEATEAGLAQLRAHGGVAYVEEDRPVYALGLYNDSGEYPWGVQAVKAQEAWALGATGAGIRVCVLDTGIDFNHPEFYKNGVSIIKGSKNFVSDGHATAQDGHGHGTHVAGTIAAQLNGTGVVGVAPDVELYIARVLGDDGSGTTSGVINGLNWCLDTAKAHVSNLSLGSSRGSKTEQNAFDNAYNKGMLSIAASGNDGTNRIGYPAKYSSVVAVGAVDNNLTLASFSNYGREQELVGPGVSVLSSVIVGTGLAGSASEDGVAYFANPLEYASKGSVSGPLVECGLADSTSSCTGIPSTGDWIALIDRGSITFADKVTNVMAQGAKGAIIANNDTANPDDAGSFTLGSDGTWIPTVSVSYNSGVAIRNNGLGSGAVAVEASDYAYYNGTSMATPHATGVAALAWSANLTLTNAKIRTILQSTAMDLGAAGWDQQYGYGLVQADAAVNQAKATN